MNYDETIKQSAYRILQVLRTFASEPDHIRPQLEHATMQRVQQMRNGERLDMSGGDLVTEVPDPVIEPVVTSAEPVVEAPVITAEPVINTPEIPEVPTGEQNPPV